MGVLDDLASMGLEVEHIGSFCFRFYVRSNHARRISIHPRICQSITCVPKYVLSVSLILKPTSSVLTLLARFRNATIKQTKNALVGAEVVMYNRTSYCLSAVLHPRS